VSCNEYNEEKRTGFLIEKIESGNTVALVSDAGTPCVSDPGYVLVKEAVKAGIRVLPIPGCCAVISGLSVSGLPTDSFLFEGFLPKKKGRRGRILEKLANEKATLIFYESPNRIVNLVQELIQLMGHRPAALAREMTKLHEEYLRGDLGTLLDELKTRDRIKGECVLFVGAGREPEPASASAEELDELILKHLDEENGKPSAVSKKIADRLSIPKNDVYQRFVELKRDRK
jgi:16S rRNA (cytidine1402-2'-O)-methyltransferase